MKIGKKAPDFTLPDVDENHVSLSDYNGKWIVLYFYPKDNTSGCTKEACDFTDLRRDYAKLNAEIIGISPDSAQSHRKFIEKHDLNITLLSDPEKKVLKKYEAWGEKKNYGRVYQGVIRSTFLISPEQTIAAIWKNVRVRVKRKSGTVKHAELVKDKLQELSSN